MNARKIKQLIDVLGITQTQLAERIDVDGGRVSRWLQGERPSRPLEHKLNELYREHVLRLGNTQLRIGVCCEFADTMIPVAFREELQEKLSEHALQFVPCPWDSRALEALYKSMRVDMVYFNKYSALRFLEASEAAFQVTEALCRTSGGHFVALSIPRNALDDVVRSEKLADAGEFLALLEEEKSLVCAGKSPSSTKIIRIVDRLITSTELIPLGVSADADVRTADLGDLMQHVIRRAFRGSEDQARQVLSSGCTMQPGMAAACISRPPRFLAKQCLACSGGHDQRAILERIAKIQLETSNAPDRYVFCVPDKLLDVDKWITESPAPWCLLVREESMLPLAYALNDELESIRSKLAPNAAGYPDRSRTQVARREIMAWQLLHNSRYSISEDPGRPQRLEEFALTADYSEYVKSWFGSRTEQSKVGSP